MNAKAGKYDRSLVCVPCSSLFGADLVENFLVRRKVQKNFSLSIELRANWSVSKDWYLLTEVEENQFPLFTWISSSVGESGKDEWISG